MKVKGFVSIFTLKCKSVCHDLDLQVFIFYIVDIYWRKPGYTDHQINQMLIALFFLFLFRFKADGSSLPLFML